MKRRNFLAVAMMLVPFLALAQPKKQIKFTLVWDAHDTDAININLVYTDGSSTITKVPYQWFWEHPIETHLLYGQLQMREDYTDICERIVEEFRNGL